MQYYPTGDTFEAVLLDLMGYPKIDCFAISRGIDKDPSTVFRFKYTPELTNILSHLRNKTLAVDMPSPIMIKVTTKKFQEEALKKAREFKELQTLHLTHKV